MSGSSDTKILPPNHVNDILTVSEISEPIREIDIENLENNSPVSTFGVECDIKGLSYVFEGELPDEPDNFLWALRIPDWDIQKTEAERLAITESTPEAIATFEEYRLGTGRAGSIEVRKVEAPDQASAIKIFLLESRTAFLPQASGYNDALGIGNFLLGNLCALADARGWRIYLRPVRTHYESGQLGDEELREWYQRNGFYDVPEGTSYDLGNMQREPSIPDQDQVIFRALDRDIQSV